MWCPKTAQTHEENIKKSRFIGVLLPSSSNDEIIEALQTLHQEHPSADHIAFAYRIKTGNGLVTRFHDAGEPGGTAGKPILQHIEGKQLVNTLLAVIRYFGGIKLGAGGLTRAYGNCAKQVIELAELIPYIDYVSYELQLNYKQMQSFEYLLKKLDGEIMNQQFEEKVRLLVKLPKQHLPALISAVTGL